MDCSQDCLSLCVFWILLMPAWCPWSDFLLTWDRCVRFLDCWSLCFIKIKSSIKKNNIFLCHQWERQMWADTQESNQEHCCLFIYLLFFKYSFNALFKLASRTTPQWNVLKINHIQEECSLCVKKEKISWCLDHSRWIPERQTSHLCSVTLLGSMHHSPAVLHNESLWIPATPVQEIWTSFLYKLSSLLLKCLL